MAYHIIFHLRDVSSFYFKSSRTKQGTFCLQLFWWNSPCVFVVYVLIKDSMAVAVANSFVF